MLNTLCAKFVESKCAMPTSSITEKCWESKAKAHKNAIYSQAHTHSHSVSEKNSKKLMLCIQSAYCAQHIHIGFGEHFNRKSNMKYAVVKYTFAAGTYSTDIGPNSCCCCFILFFLVSSPSSCQRVRIRADTNTLAKYVPWCWCAR